MRRRRQGEVTAVPRKTASDKAQRAVTWLAPLNLAALQAGGAWGDYITLGSVWLLTYLTGEIRHSRKTAVLLAIAWAACLLVPGVQPMPICLPVPLAMILTIGISAAVVVLNAWVVLRRDGMPVGGRITASEGRDLGPTSGRSANLSAVNHEHQSSPPAQDTSPSLTVPATGANRQVRLVVVNETTEHRSFYGDLRRLLQRSDEPAEVVGVLGGEPVFRGKP